MLISVHQFCSAYEVTPATVEVFYPKGFQVSIPGIFNFQFCFLSKYLERTEVFFLLFLQPKTEYHCLHFMEN